MRLGVARAGAFVLTKFRPVDATARGPARRQETGQVALNMAVSQSAQTIWREAALEVRKQAPLAIQEQASTSSAAPLSSADSALLIRMCSWR